jgi:Tol biopolymer transport system component
VGIAIAVSAAIWSAAATAAEPPPGPRLAYVRGDGAAEEFLTTGPDGADPQAIARYPTPGVPTPDPVPAFAFSPDGSVFAYAGFPPGTGSAERPEERRIYVAPVAGGAAVEVPGSVGGVRPLFAPDGQSLAVLLVRRARGHGAKVRVEQSSIWLLSLVGGASRQLTPWRSLFTDVPSSFDPDGTRLGIIHSVHFTRHGHRRSRGDAVVLPLDGSPPTRLAKGAGGLAFSPDGTRIALLRHGKTWDDLWVGASDGSGLRRISDGPRQESAVAWDPSGQRLVFVMLGNAGLFPFTLAGLDDSLQEINVDGSCETTVAHQPSVSFLSPSWLPGADRGAGPIAC